MFYDIIRTMIALACVLAIVAGILPEKQNTALRLLIGMLVLTSVLSTVRALRVMPIINPLQQLEQAQVEGESQLREQTLQLAQQRIYEDVTQLCVQYAGASPTSVRVEWTGQGQEMEIGLLAVKVTGQTGQLEQILQERYQPRQLTIEEE